MWRVAVLVPLLVAGSSASPRSQDSESIRNARELLLTSLDCKFQPPDEIRMFWTAKTLPHSLRDQPPPAPPALAETGGL
jgi:hypothetical protein